MHPMHSCLRLAEILSMIFDEFDPKNNVDRVTLNSLTRTCKTFHEPAVEKLWTTLDTLCPLFKCLPEKLWKEKRLFESAVLSLKENPSLDDLTRFSIYARRVLHLSGCIKVDTAAINAVALITKAPLLPNLRSIVVPDTIDYDHTVLPTLLGPRTETIHLHISTLNAIKAIQFFCSWRDSHPLVKRLSSRTCSDDAIQNIFDLVNKCQLEVVDAGRLSQSAISHLATSPVLRRLYLHDLQVGDLSLVTQPSFVHLSFLELFTNNSASLLKTFLELMGPCRLQELALYTSFSDDTPDHWLDCFSLLRNKCSHSSLQTLYIELSIVETTLSNCFEPLLAFHCLKDVKIINDRIIFLDDEDVRRLAVAWPEVERLCIQTDHIPNRWDRQITLEGLFFLSQHCPRLRDVSLMPIDPSHTPQITLDIPNRNIRDIDVGNSHIEKSDIARTASFFSSVFPELRTLNAWVACGSNLRGMASLYQSRWSRVYDTDE